MEGSSSSLLAEFIDSPHSRSWKFDPDDEQLVGYFLYNKLRPQPTPSTGPENPFSKEFHLYDMALTGLQNSLFMEVDLYDEDVEIWDIWEKHGGNNLKHDQALYFFTRLKKITDGGSRRHRTIGKEGTWHGEYGKRIKVGSVVGRKKLFRFRHTNPEHEHDGAWIMHEFSIEECDGSVLKDNDTVLCRLKENPKASDKKRKLKDGSFEPLNRCKFTVPILAQRLSHTGLMIQASEPEPEDPNLMFDQLSSTVEPEAAEAEHGGSNLEHQNQHLMFGSQTSDQSNAGASHNTVDIQDNTLQHLTTTQDGGDCLREDTTEGDPLVPNTFSTTQDGGDCLPEDTTEGDPLVPNTFSTTQDSGDCLPEDTTEGDPLVPNIFSTTQNSGDCLSEDTTEVDPLVPNIFSTTQDGGDCLREDTAEGDPLVPKIFSTTQDDGDCLREDTTEADALVPNTFSTTQDGGDCLREDTTEADALVPNTFFEVHRNNSCLVHPGFYV